MAAVQDDKEPVATDPRKHRCPERHKGAGDSPWSSPPITRPHGHPTPGPDRPWPEGTGIRRGKAEGAVKKSSLDIAFESDPEAHKGRG